MVVLLLPFSELMCGNCLNSCVWPLDGAWVDGDMGKATVTSFASSGLMVTVNVGIANPVCCGLDASILANK